METAEQVLNRMEQQFDRAVDAAYEEHCKRMILARALEDIIEDGTCTPSIKEIAVYALGLMADEKTVN